MITALGIGAGFVLMATVLIVATVHAASELGRLVTRDDEQRQVETAGALRIRDAVRPASRFKGTTKRATLAAKKAA